MRKTYFYLEEVQDGKYMIRLNHDKFFCFYTEGSYNVLPARIMNMSYATYLRYCRDVLGAEVYGKEHRYPIAYFRNDPLTRQFIKLLNAMAGLIEFERAFPNYEDDVESVQAYKEARDAILKLPRA